MNTNKNDYYNSISDDEIRIVGNNNNGSNQTGKPNPAPKHRLIWIIASIALVAAVATAVYMFRSTDEVQYQEPEIDKTSEVNITIAGNSTSSGKQEFATVKTDCINDIHIRIITPQGGKPELKIGNIFEDSTRVILAAQAADVRGDNEEISGAFILKGDLISKGTPKLGFCSIIDNQITIGRQSETALFERAIEENGYFFRQYSLVSNGSMISIKPKGKAIRRTLCYLHGTICIIESVGRESYHDFAQALADYGVEEAIALVGGNALLLYRTEANVIKQEGEALEHDFSNINYIVWYDTHN